MRFTFADRSYFLQFTRKHKQVTVFKNREEQQVKSLHPYTTVTLYEHADNLPTKKKFVATAEVGCAANIDAYSVEEGRRAALRSLLKSVKRMQFPKEFSAEIWNSYKNRARVKSEEPVEGEVVEAGAE